MVTFFNRLFQQGNAGCWSDDPFRVLILIANRDQSVALQCGFGNPPDLERIETTEESDVFIRHVRADVLAAATAPQIKLGAQADSLGMQGN